jgi:ADP-ribose pyrophosphatase YjhB (NUDIX family)
MNFCSHCGAPLDRRVPRGDDRPRFVCKTCQTIHYENPKIVVGCITEWEEKILLCRRGIKPRYGFWTLPAGFLEQGETLSEGASRETLEETGARVEILTHFTLFDLPHVSQVSLIFRARLIDPDLRPGRETLEVRLFRESEIPWNEIAFSSIKKSLQLYFKDQPVGVFPLHTGRISPEE